MDYRRLELAFKVSMKRVSSSSVKRDLLPSFKGVILPSAISLKRVALDILSRSAVSLMV